MFFSHLYRRIKDNAKGSHTYSRPILKVGVSSALQDVKTDPSTRPRGSAASREITLDGEGFFRRYDSFTGKEFVEFLKAACERFGKIITDGAPQHRSKFVREEIGRLDGVELQFLPPGCPDLNAIEEVWRQMKHAIAKDTGMHNVTASQILTYCSK